MKAADKICDLELLETRLQEARAAGKTVALANGLFDILHVGHLRYLEDAGEEADILLVGVNSDASARALRGPSKPVIPQEERAELVAGLACVDLVTIFAGSTAKELLQACRPDVHCKGTDYTVETVPEYELAQSLGIRVAIVGDRKQHSTRDIIKRLRETQT